MIRNIGAGVLGVAIAIALVSLIETLGHTANPMPEGLDYKDTEAMAAYIATVPVGALLSVVAAWVVGTFAGTIAACRIGTAPPYIFAMLVGAFVLMGITMNLMAFPHPTWMAVSGVIGTIVAAWAGMILGRKKADTAA
jgi:uncharacterized protein YacL